MLMSSSRPKKARQVRSNIKSILVTFSDWEVIVHQELFLQAKRWTSITYYLEVLKRLREQVHQKRSRTMAEPGLVASPRQCAGAHCFFVCTSILGRRKHGYGPPLLLAWFGPLWIFLVYVNEIESKRASFPGCHWNSGTITDRPMSSSKKLVPAVLPAVAETLVNVKLSLCFKWAPRYEGVLGEWRYSSTHSWPRHYMEVGGQLHSPAALFLGKDPLEPIG
jgi:hypothetical protein